MVAVSCTRGPEPNQSSSSPPTLVDLTPKSPAPVVTGPLHTRGTQILGPGGESVRLTGINLQGMQISNDSGTAQPDACGRAWRTPPQDAARNIRTWGFNSVRLPFAWANLEPIAPTLQSDGTLTHHWSEEYLTALDKVIASLAAERLVVILDPAQFQWSSAFKANGLSGGKVTCEGYGVPAWLNPNAPNETINQVRCDFIANRPESGVPQRPWDGLSAVWTMLGQRYSDNEAIVAADTFNEPFFVQPTCPGADFPGFFKSIGTAIRAVAPHWLLIFEYLPSDAAAFGLTSPPPFKDQLYSVHVYAPDWATAQAELMDPAWTTAQQWGMPVFVGEFSAFGATSNRGGDPGWQDETRQMLAYMKERGISWTVFGYAGGLSVINRDGQPRVEVIRILQEGF
jgi:hypothetical protein